jgi:hypothetical protein
MSVIAFGGLGFDRGNFSGNSHIFHDLTFYS